MTKGTAIALWLLLVLSSKVLLSTARSNPMRKHAKLAVIG